MILEQQLSVMLQKLNTTQKQIVYNFLKDLLAMESKKSNDGKAILLRTSVWDEESIQQIEDARKHVNTWNPIRYS